MLIYGKSGSMISLARVLLLLLIADELWRPAFAQNITDATTCSRYVEYLDIRDNEFMARVRIPKDVPATQNSVAKIQLALQEPVKPNSPGNFFLWDQFKNADNWTYGVHFPNPKLKAKVINIKFNDKSICSESEHFASTTELEHTLDRDCRHIETKVYTRTECDTYAISATKPLRRPHLCGREGEQRRDFKPFVRGGTEILRGQFPWLTAIYKTEVGQLTFVCGGSLISSRTVVTAAHCVTYPNTIADHELVVYLGRHNLKNFTEGFESHEVKSLLIHPEYDRVSLYPDADIAILILKSYVSFSPYIQPICLWSEPTDVSRIVGEQGVVVGWGADETGRPVSNLPKMVHSEVVSENACRDSSAVFRVLTSSRTFCAGNRNGTGPCTGDSGGGLMFKRDGLWMLRGIVSAGVEKNGECDANEYVIYCDVAKHMRWVQDNDFY